MTKILLRSTMALILSLIVTGTAAIAQSLPAPTHIVILWEENYAYSQIIGSASAPHINALAAMPNAAVFTNFLATDHPSQPNYLEFFSGANQGVTTDDLPVGYPFTTPNLCAELLAVHKTYTAYCEDLPAVGSDVETYTTGSANYWRKHNPCTNWVGTGTNQFAATVNQPYTNFPTNYATLPTVSYVVPNCTNDMHDYTTWCSSVPCPESIQLGDTWMYNNLDSLRKWSIDNNTLYIVIYDEDDDFHGNVIPVIFYGPMVKTGTYSENINFYNLLRTIEDMYGTGHAGAAATATDITDCWQKVSSVNNVASAKYDFKVMPNPASNYITFNCNSATNPNFTIIVTDETGRKSGTYTMNSAEVQVNTTTYAPGLYFYSIQDENNRIVSKGKFVVSHN